MKSPTACLNEVLLSAALRFERVNADRIADREAKELARRNDKFANEFTAFKQASQDAQAG